MSLTPQLLSTHLLASLSPSRPVRQAAETALSQLRAAPGNVDVFPGVLIGLVTDAGVDRSVRTAAAVYWKNGCAEDAWGCVMWIPRSGKRNAEDEEVVDGWERWRTMEERADDEVSTSSNIPALQEQTKDTIKQQLVQIMISLGDQPSLQSQVAEAVARIAQYDFPEKWMTLPDQLTAALSPTSFEQTNAVLSLAHSIFRRWRSQFRTDKLFLEIKFVLEKFCPPYLEVFK
ncbi:ARM repeat-containing protein, partial [Atractiella rhizophila]